MSSAIETIFLITGGLGLFLFGMKMMSSGIETIAGDRLHAILQRATSNRFLAVAMGILATIAINSSTATTIMTVSFVNSGLMNLTQSMGIILGANVGTTFSAQLIAFRVDTVAPLFIFVGIILHLFVKKKRIKNIGYVILGFGILFFGITVMGTPLRALANEPAFNAILSTFANPVLALLAGFIFTAVVQSSSATMGILVTMHLSGVPITFETSAFIILGTNIGTSITTVIASIPANRESKRAALFHIMFDIIGSTVFGTLIVVFPGILGWFESTWTESARQVAMFHTLYNFATMFLILPFINQVALLMQKIVPIKASDTNSSAYDRKLMYLDTKIAQSPSMLIRNAHLELCRIQGIANETLELAAEAFFKNDMESALCVRKNKKSINSLIRKTTARLVKVNNATLSQADARRLGKMFRTLYDIERIGDHAENITEYTEQIVENELHFPEAATLELRELSALTMSLSAMSLQIFEKQDSSLLPQIKELEKKVDNLSKKLTENHIVRLSEESFEPRCGVIFTDMIIDLERCGDHANNIASSMPSAPKVNKDKKRKDAKDKGREGKEREGKE